jgi:hypothetical protein
MGCCGKFTVIFPEFHSHFYCNFLQEGSNWLESSSFAIDFVPFQLVYTGSHDRFVLHPIANMLQSWVVVMLD